MPAERDITYDGITDSITGWSIRFGVSKQRISARMKRHGGDVTAAFRTLGDYQREREGSNNMGRPRKSIEEKRLAGTLEKRDMPKAVVSQELLAGAPVPPSYLSSVGKDAWIHICNEMAKAKVLTTGDHMIVEMACQTYSRLREAQYKLDQYGSLTYTMVNKMGSKEVPYPEVKIVEDNTRIIASLLGKLGMTPVSRGAVTPVSDETEHNPFAEFE